MYASSRSKNTIPTAATIFALLGLLWCAYVAFPIGASAPCTTAGCALFQDGKFFGISLWWVGGAVFLVLTLLCLRGMRYLAWLLARLALAIDCLLLVVMFFTAPCVNCLIVAVFFALTCLALRPPAHERNSSQSRPWLIIPLWLGLFLGNSALVLDEITERWSIAGPENAQIAVFFSPSCEYCHNALVETAGRARLYPVIKEEGDLEAVLRLQMLLKQNVPMAEALAKSRLSEPKIDIPLPAKAMYMVDLLRNKSYVFKHGNGVLPLVIIQGGPSGQALASPKAANGAAREPQNQNLPAATPGQPAPVQHGPTSSSENGANPQVMPWDVNLMGNCPQDSPEPCD